MPFPFAALIIPLVLVGVALWALREFTPTPIDAQMAKFIRVIVIVLVVLWLLNVLFGLSGGGGYFGGGYSIRHR